MSPVPRGKGSRFIYGIMVGSDGERVLKTAAVIADKGTRVNSSNLE